MRTSRATDLTTWLASRLPHSAIILTFLSMNAVAQAPSERGLGPGRALTSQDFIQIAGVRELLDGGLLVTDAIENRLYYIDPRGGSTVLGRSGDGPNEFRAVGPLAALARDSTFMLDPGSSRWIIIAGSQIVASIPATSGLPREFRTRLLGADSLGNVLAWGGIAFSGTRRLDILADTIVFILANRQGTARDTIGRGVGRGSAGVISIPPRNDRPGFLNLSNPLASEDQALLFPDGWVAVARVTPYRVDWRAPDGRWVEGQRLPPPVMPITPALRCTAIARWAEVDSSCDSSLYPAWPQRVPPFLPAGSQAGRPILIGASGGRLVIARTPEIQGNSLRHPYDIVDRSGALISRLNLEGTAVVVGTGRTGLYVVHRDPDGLQQLRLHAWP